MAVQSFSSAPPTGCSRSVDRVSAMSLPDRRRNREVRDHEARIAGSPRPALRPNDRLLGSARSWRRRGSAPVGSPPPAVGWDPRLSCRGALPDRQQAPSPGARSATPIACSPRFRLPINDLSAMNGRILPIMSVIVPSGSSARWLWRRLRSPSGDPVSGLSFEVTSSSGRTSSRQPRDIIAGRIASSRRSLSSGSRHALGYRRTRRPAAEANPTRRTGLHAWLPSSSLRVLVAGI